MQDREGDGILEEPGTPEHRLTEQREREAGTAYTAAKHRVAEDPPEQAQVARVQGGSPPLDLRAAIEQETEGSPPIAPERVEPLEEAAIAPEETTSSSAPC